MSVIFAAPGKYIQGRNELKNLEKHLSKIGKKALVTGNDMGLGFVKDALKEGNLKEGNKNECEMIYDVFQGESSMTEIHRLEKVFRQNQCDVLVGAGGGKVLDAVKAAAHLLRAPVVVIPTAASTDAPCSALSIIYKDDHTLDFRMPLPKSPDIILVDTQIIANAPANLLVAGMGDALSTYFEARACFASASDNVHCGKSSATAQVISRYCYDVLLADGLRAKIAVENNLVTPAVENIIEANTLLSGIGFESGGKGAAHPIGDGLNTISECRSMHGEKVAFGSLVQLMMENAPTEEINQAYAFCHSVGLPVTLAELGITEEIEEKAAAIAKVATQPEKPIYHMPFPVDEAMVKDAILAANAYGAAYFS